MTDQADQVLLCFECGSKWTYTPATRQAVVMHVRKHQAQHRAEDEARRVLAERGIISEAGHPLSGPPPPTLKPVA